MKRSRDGGDVVDAEAEPALMRRERVGDDGRGIGEEHGAADALSDPHGDEPQAPADPESQVIDEQDGEGGEDGEAEVEHLAPGRTCRRPDPA